MKKKRFVSICALLLSAVICLTACMNPLEILEKALPRITNLLPWVGGDGAGVSDRRVIPFSQMQYERPDVESMKAQLEKLAEEMESADSFSAAVNCMNQAGGIFEAFSTMYSLAQLNRYLHSNDDSYREELEFCGDAAVEISLLGNRLNRIFVEGAYGSDYREAVGEYYYQSVLDGLRLQSPEVESYKKEREKLDVEYNDKLANMTLRYEGEEYTMEDILALSSSELRGQLYNEFYRENAPTFTGIYSKMIELDKKTADTLGFLSPAEMYYLTYSRDYTPQDAMTFCEASKRIFAPMVDDVMAVYVPSISMSMGKTFSTMPSALRQIDPELEEVWNKMIEYELYDYEPRSEKQSGIAFTTDLYAYDAPFCYGYWEGDFRSASTVMHEFGHFYESWMHYDSMSVFNLDIAETYSQGLELLMHGTYEEFTDSAEDAAMANLMDFFEVMLYQALLEEFQQKVYALDSFDEKEIAKMYVDLFEEYGYGDYVNADEDGCDYSWYRVTHLFDSPFYTISYCTSASAALQIWAIAEEDWRAGADLYLELMHADQNQPFTQLIESVGLRAPTEAAVLEELADRFAEVFGISSIRLPAAA